ncbi:MAG: hypothetical protein IPN74_10375 [Haliscomenobacter sp.]|nr:hypothetical protein [Haliscomenobacter sp.]
MDRIKLRRSYNATCEADFVAKGYDWDKNNKIEAGKDGWDENGDGTLQDHEKFVSVTRSGVATIMTPWLDYAEFFCCDLGNKVIVELGGWDKAGNFNYCWSEQLIEDKVLPTIHPSMACNDQVHRPRVCGRSDRCSWQHRWLGRNEHGIQELCREGTDR